MIHVAKCVDCKHVKTLRTGGDEYPPYTKLVYCFKGHWVEGDISTPQEEESFRN